MNDDEFKELVYDLFDLDEELTNSQKLELARKLLFSISKTAPKEVADKVLTFATEEEVVAYLKSVAKA